MTTNLPPHLRDTTYPAYQPAYPPTISLTHLIEGIAGRKMTDEEAKKAKEYDEWIRWITYALGCKQGMDSFRTHNAVQQIEWTIGTVLLRRSWKYKLRLWWFKFKEKRKRRNDADCD